MSFADSVKKELISKNIKETHCKIAFLSGIVRGSGVLFERNGEFGVDFRVGSEECAKYVSNLLKEIFDYDVREVSVSENVLSKNEKFIITVTGESAYVILKELNILHDEKGQLTVNFDIFSQYKNNECCLRNFFKGLFIASGTCTVPRGDGKNTNTGYHLEFSFSHNTPAQATALKLSEIGVNPKITLRKGKYVVYVKSAEEIKDFFAFLSAPLSVLKLTELMISKEISNNSNRQKNCDLGNLNRQIIAVEKQLAAIKIIEKFGWGNIKPELKQVASERKKAPEESLTELAQRLGISKSCLNHRLRKLINIANDLKR